MVSCNLLIAREYWDYFLCAELHKKTEMAATSDNVENLVECVEALANTSKHVAVVAITGGKYFTSDALFKAAESLIFCQKSIIVVIFKI